MKKTEVYTVPDYFGDFKCKMGACRHACCEGWPVSISLNDYYRLIGEDCSPELRRRIDGSIHLQPHPTDEDYAAITPNWLGRCPMRLEDGRCALHAELGEMSLSQVCRLYPRGVRKEGDLECSCANSCEAVIEMFLSHPEPIAFMQIPLDIEAPEPRERTVFFETVGREQEIRMYFIGIMQRRDVSLPARFAALGHAMIAMSRCLKDKDASGVDRLLSDKDMSIPEQSYSHTDEDIASGIEMAEKLLAYIDEHSRSIHDYGCSSLEYFGTGKEAADRYRRALGIFASVLPDWEIVFEHMLVNHMFFERFPFQDRPETIYEEFAALCMIYMVLRCLSLGWVAEHPDREAFADVCAAAFRFFDHTSFDRHASGILMRLGYTDSEDILHLLML